jgi:hypothetical protein
MNPFRLLTSTVFFISALAWGFLWLFSSCNNEIPLYGENKNKVVVYGFLDVNAPVQYIRVGKTFLPSIPHQTVVDVAQIADSLYFKNVEVSLIEQPGGKEIFLHLTDTLPKLAGYFQHEKNYLYATNEALQPNASYQLKIINKETGVISNSTTNLVKNPYLSYPTTIGSRQIAIHPQFPELHLSFVLGTHAKMADAFFEFWVDEFPEYDTTSKRTVKLTWHAWEGLSLPQNQPTFQNKISGIHFYHFFLDQFNNGVLLRDTFYQRRIVRTDFTLVTWGKDVELYKNANENSLSVVQKIGSYTNITNGLGVFSSKNVTTVKHLILNEETIQFFHHDDYPQFKVLRILP